MNNRCPLCEHGVLSEVQNGFMRYSVCDGCDSELANDEQTTWNKQNAILNDEKLLWYCSRQEDKYICDCEENYDKECKHPEDYRSRGCNGKNSNGDRE